MDALLGSRTATLVGGVPVARRVLRGVFPVAGAGGALVA